MKKLITKITATAVITSIGYTTTCGLINILTRSIDNPEAHLILSFGVVIWVAIIAVYLIAVAFAEINAAPSPPSRRIIYTDRELDQRDRQAILTDPDDIFTLNQESLKRKYAIRD